MPAILQSGNLLAAAQKFRSSESIPFARPFIDLIVCNTDMMTMSSSFSIFASSICIYTTLYAYKCADNLQPYYQSVFDKYVTEYIDMELTTSRADVPQFNENNLFLLSFIEF
ncbi:hypothetical protein WUBG_01809 [Wuchereria bancrofti]|uniref:Uncharacterized protein n=1 Tax=Wuchereria bancrofti TaxID=6293 RepID=J9EYH0_WUCBA|nr:hypothetical protein WUBG_01809 [Wuchereria bancrofti]